MGLPSHAVKKPLRDAKVDARSYSQILGNVHPISEDLRILSRPHQVPGSVSSRIIPLIFATIFSQLINWEKTEKMNGDHS